MADEPFVARLHPVRGPGVFYGALGLLVLVVVLGGFGSNLMAGRLVTALVVLVAGLGVSAFLAVLCAAILGPELLVGPTGIAGRVSWRQRLDQPWDAVTIDVAPESPHGRFELDLGVDTLEVATRSWTGFGDFVLVVASTPAAIDRLSPSATEELLRMLGYVDPDGTGGVPDPA